MKSPFDDMSPDCADADTLDRLVDGTLPEAVRRRFLLSLEVEPGGWRRCALAFLEAQAWREALAPLVLPAHAETVAPVSLTQAAKVRPWRTLARRSTFAASLLVAFALGWMLQQAEPRAARHELSQIDSPAPIINTVPSVTDPVVRAEDKLPAPGQGESNSDVEAVVKSWERQGYLAERQRTVVDIRFEDGREREVPAEEIRLRYTGNRVY